MNERQTSTDLNASEPARLAALAAAQTSKHTGKAHLPPTSRPTTKARKNTNSVRRGDNMGEVIVDGVTFEFDETGTRLVKKAPRAAGEDDEHDTPPSAENTSTPLRTSIDGKKFVRTKTGNLISKELLDRRRQAKRDLARLQRLDAMGKQIAAQEKVRSRGKQSSSSIATRKKQLCTFFTKTGQCKNGLSCPFQHDPSRVAICPKILRPAGCPLPSGTCPLSHEPRVERVPHCVHFLGNAGACRNGDACLYTHPPSDIHLTNESPICAQFSQYGWCQRGDRCIHRHTFDCPDFLRKGQCDRRGCRLMHVVRSSKESESQSALEDAELFVRDDDAHLHEDSVEEGEEQAANQGPSHKRPRYDEDDPHSTVSFQQRRSQSKAFTGQNDFISLDDDAEDEQGDEQEDEQESSEEDEDASVHTDASDE